MFVRDKRIGRYTYVYLVENVREGGGTKQRIIANLGRKETVLAHGDLDRLARSVAAGAALDGAVGRPGRGAARCGVPADRPGSAVRPAVARGRLPGGVDGSGRTTTVRLCGRARGVSDCAASPVCLGLRPGGGKVACRPPHRRHRGVAAA